MSQDAPNPREGLPAPEPADGTAIGPVHPDGPVDPGAETIEAEPGSSEGSKAKPASDSQRLRCREFGEYEIISEVARGAMGIVYRARHKRLDRVVALKVLLSGEHASEAEIRRFTREAQALARLRHPNIVPIYDIGEVAGRHYFTMDFIDGQTLNKILSERQPTTIETLKIMEQIADAVSGAHGRGVIHRDVKPSNIMLDAEGGVHVMDFGLSKASGTDSKHTRDGTTIGTPAYMSPEQAKGEVSRVDERSDVYSMGAVFYEMLAGRAPFGGTNLLEIVLAVINEDPPRLRSVNPRVPRELEIIVQKAMDKDPARRYRTAADFRDELRRYQAGEPIRARAASFWYLAAKKVRKHWAALTVAASVCAVAALATTGFIYYKRVQSERERARLQAEKEELERQREFAEGAKPVWREQFTAADLSDGWEDRQVHGDVFLDPTTGEERTLRPDYDLRLHRTPVFGNVRLQLDFTLNAQAPGGQIAFGFAGNTEPPQMCLFRLTPGRAELLANINPDGSSAPITVVADRRIPRLEPGKRYRAVVERMGLGLSLVISTLPEGAAAATGNGSEIARIEYAHVNLSNWRYRNLRAAVRGAGRSLTVTGVAVERQLMPRVTSRLAGAEKSFCAGDYNDAFDEYSAILVATPEDDAPRRLAERAQAHYRLGLYHEVKGELAEARDSYAQASTLAARVPADSRDEALDRAASEALVHSLAVAGRMLATGKAQPDDFRRAVAAASGTAALRGAWLWSMEGLVGEMTSGGQVLPAAELARMLDAPAGSLSSARSLAMLARALVDIRRHRDVPAIVERCPEPPLAAPLAAAVRAGATGTDLDWSLSALRTGVRVRVFAPGSVQTAEPLRAVCDAGILAGNYALVKDAIYEAVGDAAVAEPIKDVIRRSVAAAVRAASEKSLDAKKSREQALQLLSLAADKVGSGDQTVSLAAVELGRRFCKAGDYASLSMVAARCHTEQLADVYAEAAGALAGSSPLVALGIVEEARDSFPAATSQGLAEAAVRIGQGFTRCATPDEEKLLLRSYEAWPDAGHIENFVTALDMLAGDKVKKKHYKSAGELLAYIRARQPADARLVDRASRIIESAKKGDEIEAFLRPLLEIEATLAGREEALAAWRLELAGYYLLLGDLQAAGAAYDRIWSEQQAKVPALAARAMFRNAMLLALEGSRAAPDKLKAARRLAEESKGAEATAFAARGALDKELIVDNFRAENDEKKHLSPAEIELVLAARAAMENDNKLARERLAAASKALVGREWPYELIKIEMPKLTGGAL